MGKTVLVLLHGEERVAGEAAINKGPDHPNAQSHSSSRKLLQSDDDGGDMNSIGSSCSKADIVISQGPTSPLPQGIPIFTVQILNVCTSDCSISNIHVSCGWFSSVRLVNPRVFRRVYYDDCLVNDGNSLGPGQSLSFQYSNSFQYPLSVSSAECE
ncbi:TPD1 protein homolog 1-like [Rhodamnia argentea]|uniref:TPD1 protein homolog 1-like n=1 Tax=Rhodamnia argentea TaxID=178133 RepID=A0A8B8MVF0_9MYRT|nr:TPD1 protein homolog 1-like [Rhodamnia argentea]